jgi:hypothetical protein
MASLTTSDKEYLMSQFPNIKLSYETIIYKKVYNSENILVIPEGKKCFAWFTNYNNKNICLIMELGYNKQIIDIRILSACYSNELAYGTIFYGTLFNYSNNRFFSIEDVYFLKGEDISRENWGSKLKILNKILEKDLKQLAYNKHFIIFGLPIICKTNEELNSIITNIPYKINVIQYRLYNKVNSFLFMKYNDYLQDQQNVHKNIKEPIHIQDKKTPKRQKDVKENKEYKKEQIFIVRPDIQDDIYYLYSEQTEEPCGLANIPDFTTSVMMNKLFRIIKENTNLDALEESDDEDEFENDKIDKFVKLDTSHKMVCQYNYKFKKWTPIRLADEKNYK